MFDFGHAEPRSLRPHQAKAIDMLRSSLGKGNKRVVLQAPTGFGKSLTAAKIIESALAKGREVLFTVPRLSLVDQAVKEFEREGIRHIGVIQANHPRTDGTAPVQVASVQTLARRGVPPSAGLVIVDECHETFRVIYDMMGERPETPFVGLSATPWAKGMGKHWQDLCVAATIGDLIESGFLSQFVAYAPDVPDLSGVKTVAGEYTEAGLDEVMTDKKLVGHVVETWLERGGNRPTLCFGASCNHARIMFEQFTAAGVAAAYVDAYTDTAERDHIARLFKAGDVKVACSVRTLTTGVDWPVSCIIDAAPTQSEMLHVQKIGRGLRINPGTEDLIILDHASNSLRLGLVTDIYHGKLDAGDKKAKPERKAGEKLPKECANCGALHGGLVCPFCGHERKPAVGIETVDGVLSIVSGKEAAVTKALKQEWWSGLLYIARMKGRSKGWASHTYRDKFSVWPKGLADDEGPASSDMWNYVKAKDIRFAKRREALS
jgi:superfamily II DNA or RNA helicase